MQFMLKHHSYFNTGLYYGPCGSPEFPIIRIFVLDIKKEGFFFRVLP